MEKRKKKAFNEKLELFNTEAVRDIKLGKRQ